MEFRFIDESGRLRLSGFGVVREREEGIESAIAGVTKRNGSRHLNKDCIFYEGGGGNSSRESSPKAIMKKQATIITESCCVAED